MSWYSPTSFSDPDGQWTNEPLIYDEILTTRTDCNKNSIPLGGYGPYLYLIRAAVVSGKIQVYVVDNFDDATDYLLDMDVYRDGGWVDVYEGHLPNGWNEKSFTPGVVTQARIRCKNPPGLNISWTPSVYEFDFEEVAPTAPSGCTAHYVATDKSYCTWTDNSDNELQFRVEYRINGGSWTFFENAAKNAEQSSQYTVGANKKIEWQVRAENYNFQSAYSTSGIVYTTPAAPSGCSISLLTIRVQWTDNSTYEDGFKVERNLDDVGWSEVQTVGAGVQEWDDASQPTGSNVKYQYRVRAYIGTLYSGYSTSNVLYFKTCSESLSLSDSLIKAITKAPFTESISLIDTLQKQKQQQRTFTESITISDIYSRVWTIYRTFTESISLSDTYTRIVTWFRTFTESITLTDSVKKAVSKTFSEAIALSDVLLKKVLKTFTESIILTDIYSRAWNIYRTFTEILNLTDSVIKKAIKSFSETLHLTDSYQRVVTWHRTFTETISLADSLRKTISKTFLESLGLADTLIKKVTYDRANKLQALESDKMFPSNIVRNIQHGLDAAKVASPVRGDWYIATNTQKVYVCFLGGTWVQIYP